MAWLVLAVLALWGASSVDASPLPLPEADLPPVDDVAAREAARQLAIVAASSKPAVRAGKQPSPLVKELQRRMGDPDPDGRLGPMTRALASRYGVTIS